MASIFGCSRPCDPASKKSIEASLGWRGSKQAAWLKTDRWDWFFSSSGSASDGYFFQDKATGLSVWVDGYLVTEDHPNSAPHDAAGLLQQWVNCDSSSSINRLCGSFAGAFAAAIWSEREQCLWLIRDPAGARPLYYALRDGAIAFASATRAIHDSGLVEKALNHAAVDYYLAMVAVPDPHTAYRDVQQVPPGHYLEWRDGNATLYRYWSMYERSEESAGATDNEAEAVARLRESLDHAIRDAVRTDRALGSFLSGGHDTSTVVGIASRFYSKPLKTFTIGFGDQAGYELYNEFSYARMVADHFNCVHSEYNIRPQDVVEGLPKIVWHLSSPSGDAINSYLVSQVACKSVEVALTGTGGDELFIGSHWYLQLFRLNQFERRWHRLPRVARQLLLRGARTMLPGSSLQRKLARIEFLSSSPQAKYSHLKCLFKEDERLRLYSEDFLPSLSSGETTLDIIERLLSPVIMKDTLSQFIHLFVQHELGNLQVRDVDAMAYAHALEARSPLLDRRVLDAVAAISPHLLMKNGQLRYLMIRACHDVLLPSTIERKKMSFIVPMSLWARNELFEPIHRLLSPAAVENRGIFNQAAVARQLKDFFITGEEPYPFKVWNLALLELWCRINLDNNFSSPPTMPLSELL